MPHVRLFANCECLPCFKTPSNPTSFGCRLPQVIAADLQTRWEKEGTMNPAVFKSFRDEILTPGGLRPAAESVEAFLGRPYTFDSYAAKIRQQEEAAGAGAASTQAQAAGG